MKCQSTDTFGKLFCNENWQETLHLELKSNLVERTNNAERKDIMRAPSDES